MSIFHTKHNTEGRREYACKCRRRIMKKGLHRCRCRVYVRKILWLCDLTGLTLFKLQYFNICDGISFCILSWSRHGMMMMMMWMWMAGERDTHFILLCVACGQLRSPLEGVHFIILFYFQIKIALATTRDKRGNSAIIKTRNIHRKYNVLRPLAIKIRCYISQLNWLTENAIMVMENDRNLFCSTLSEMDVRAVAAPARYVTMDVCYRYPNSTTILFMLFSDAWTQLIKLIEAF